MFWTLNYRFMVPREFSAAEKLCKNEFGLFFVSERENGSDENHNWIKQFV